MNNITQSQLFKTIVTKATLKQDVYHKTLDAFAIFKDEASRLAGNYQSTVRRTKYPILFEFKDMGQFQFELKFGGDILIFMMHTNVFEFSRNHEVMRSSYIKEDPSRSYCGIIYIFNFLADSFKYNRTNDLGYLIGRVFVNREMHYFIEGKREVGLLYNNFPSSKLNKQAIHSIIQSAVLYTINFDLLTPPFENMQEVTVNEMQTTLDNMQIRTAKRLGYRYQADRPEEETGR
jgi:hypothetical protein